MPDPTGYSVSYSFAGWQSSNPSKPLPAVSIDNEFGGIAVSLASVIAALADVRRSDGRLAVGSVGLDQLTDDVKGLFGDPRVLVSDLNPASFATQEQAAAGAASDRLMTPLRTKQALDALRAFASQGEAEAGDEPAKVLSPLGGKQMLDKLRAFASQAEAEGVAVDDKVLSPLRAKQMLDKVHKILSVSQSLDFGSISAGASQTITVTATGTQVGDCVAWGLPAAGIEDGLVATVWASAVHTVSVRLRNITGSPIDPAAATWKFKVLRF